MVVAIVCTRTVCVVKSKYTTYTFSLNVGLRGVEEKFMDVLNTQIDLFKMIDDLLKIPGIRKCARDPVGRAVWL